MCVCVHKEKIIGQKFKKEKMCLRAFPNYVLRQPVKVQASKKQKEARSKSPDTKNPHFGKLYEM